MGFREMHDPTGGLGLLLFPFFIIAIWCFVCFVISRFGWSSWARIYRCDRQLQGKVYRGRSGRFKNQKSYQRALKVVLCEDGIGPFSGLSLSHRHPPLLLPWSKIVGVEEKNYFFFRLLRITLSDAGKTFTFELPLSAKPEFERRTLGFRGQLYPQTPPPL
jgi:hypothetical protein